MDRPLNRKRIRPTTLRRMMVSLSSSSVSMLVAPPNHSRFNIEHSQPPSLRLVQHAGPIPGTLYAKGVVPKPIPTRLASTRWWQTSLPVVMSLVSKAKTHNMARDCPNYIEVALCNRVASNSAADA
jgi:hypothetical protein